MADTRPRTTCQWWLGREAARSSTEYPLTLPINCERASTETNISALLRSLIKLLFGNTCFKLLFSPHSSFFTRCKTQTVEHGSQRLTIVFDNIISRPEVLIMTSC